ncbi:MAG: nucleotidyl transferase AbiEii/AbiGii toxin family protein, partial [Desulfobaccales bacterium]
MKKKGASKKAAEPIDPLVKLEQIKRLGIIAMFSDDYLMERLALKGGNAIDLVHKGPCRASVDLDFSMDSEFEEDLNAIKDRIEKALQITFRAEGFVVFDPRLCSSLGHHGQKMVLGTPLPGENLTKLLFLTPNLHLDGTVA